MISILIGYLLIVAFLVMNYQEVNKSYNVRWNGSRWVVRDSYGKFVTITRSLWDVLSLAYKVK